jgi:glycosyltransferase involved in cell wall biosynthesis
MLLSIVIPTKDRYTTLFNVIDTILAFQDNEIEIVIQDNSGENEEALAFVNQHSSFGNLKYFYEAKPLSVIENSNRAVLNSNGDFICFIGDDDGVMPYIVDVVRWMKKNSVSIVKGNKPIYYWPNQKSNYFDTDANGKLRIRALDYGIHIKNSSEALKRTLAIGGTDTKFLPCLYHGIVERKKLEMIYQKTGSFFPGPSPDMANSIALMKVTDEFYYLDFPIAITGKSTLSTGGAGILHKHISKIEDVKHLPKDTAENWSQKIPKYWTGPTIWAESVIKALSSFNDEVNIRKLNLTYLYAFIYVFNYKSSKAIFSNFGRYKSMKFYYYGLKAFIGRALAFVKNRYFNNEIRFQNVNDMKSAINHIMSSINLREINNKLK